MGRFKDITGQRFGKLVAIKPTDKRQGTNVVWLFRCDCGNTCEKTTTHLTDTSSCGCSSWSSLKRDISGQKYGRLTAIEPTGCKTRGGMEWLFRCDCGNYHKASISAVTSGKTTSCGCYKREVTASINLVDLVGRRFGMLEIIGQGGRNTQGAILWECLCDCGKTVYFTANQLNAGHKLNCGCKPDYKFYCVYKHVFPDGRVYVGKTTKMPVYRWYSGYKQQYEIRQAILSIGENWINEIQHYYLSARGEWALWNQDLGFNDTNIFSRSGAARLEKKWISDYNATNPACGLNCTTGGDKDYSFNEESRKRNADAQPDRSGENSPFYGRPLPEETKQKLSVKAKQRYAETGIVNFKGQHHSEETKAALRKKALERDEAGIKPFKGKHHTEEAKQRFSEQNSKPITQYDLIGKKIKTFPSLQLAAEEMNMTNSALSDCANKRTTQSAGYIWRYIDADQLPASEMPSFIHNGSKAVLQYGMDWNLIAKFDSLKDTAAAIGRSVTSLSSAIKKGGDATCGGFHWKFADESVSHGNTKKVTQCDLEGNEIIVFNSVIEAAQATGIDKKGISRAATGKQDTAGGYKWRY